MKNALKHFPELEGEELQYVYNSVKDLDEEQFEVFKASYRARRKDPLLFLILAMLGFFGIAGIHRFFVGHIGIGLLYIVTIGFCGVGTIVDMINYKTFSFEYNRKQALQILQDIE
ncbi:TM2 domain-containing protein [Rhodohalobacter sp. SW132]|uniref:TM2 domain-containing protein n=1 Tax=Rhodohalobacter sp. SW132 TaxID=2293433 RepID=UPI000E2854BC|nr:TM2 domain-containing protein [Rhodohalobacter sp. SW132]REL37595.1 TM2 domain-containing protein [Rhodohalobacter sp. SW132]